MGFKLKTRTLFPALVEVLSPLTLTKQGLSYIFGLDVSQLAIGQTQLPQVAIRKPASAASIAITPLDIEVGIDTRSIAVSAALPSVAQWVQSNPFGLELTLVDYFGNASINNITPVLNGSDVFVWGGITPVINANFGLLKLRPDPSLPGWIIRGLN